MIVAEVLLLVNEQQMQNLIKTQSQENNCYDIVTICFTACSLGFSIRDMETNRCPSRAEKSAKPQLVTVYEFIPRNFPTKMSLVKVICIGVGITIAQYAFLVLLIAKPWH